MSKREFCTNVASLTKAGGVISVLEMLIGKRLLSNPSKLMNTFSPRYRAGGIPPEK